MKIFKTIMPAVCMMLILSIPTHVFAENKRLNKLKRGLINVATAPLEVPKSLYTIGTNFIQLGPYANLFPFIMIVNICLVGRGFGLAMIREVSGGWDVISFAFPVPADYEPILKPDYFWQEGIPKGEWNGPVPKRGRKK